ncbi:Hypothetical predicted protein [Paramuricea clavata]|uniref:Uncharacterized protein n=1 Tax=Paramuricea clavata TaxID=317549 RepID=A0A6S7IR64_PARCT|nr:Hypothetical predicted protein [Paramuricea clavata]
MKLKTFAAMKVKKSCTVKDRSLTLKADRHIFARLLVIRGKRDVSLKEVLTYSLGPIPWSLATADGSFVKTVKSKLLDAIEKDVVDSIVDTLPDNCVRIFDGMVIIQQMASLSLARFGEISEYVLKRITSRPGKVIYFVTDQYLDDSLKGSERQRQAASGSIWIHLTRRDQKRPKQFKKYLSDGVNKVDLLRVEEDNVVIGMEESLCSNQEEADTKMFLCCQHAVHRFQNPNICISTVDSDVGILAIYFKQQIHCNMFLEIGSKGKKRILSIQNISEGVGEQMSSALPALHAISGCDSTSAFYGLGKQKVYKIVKSCGRFKETLAQMGDSFDFDTNLFLLVEEMVAQFYGIKGCTSINDALYMKFCTKNKIPEPQQLPPTKDELLLHCQHANYVTCIWKSALTMNTDPPQPEGRGWL